MQALKGLVVGLGVLIIAGFALLAYGFYLKITDPEFRVTKPSPGEAVAQAASQAPSTRAPAPVASRFGEVRLALPEGCTVAEMRPDGGRLYLRIGPEGLCERIVVVETATGAVVGTIAIRP